MRALLLPLHESAVAVVLETARDVVAKPLLTPLPTAPPIVLGMFNRRGDLLPVVDTGVLLGAQALGADGAIFAVVVQCGSEQVGLATSAALTVVRLDGEPQPPHLPGVVGIYRLGDQPVPLIDPQTLLAHAGLSADDSTRPGDPARAG